VKSADESSCGASGNPFQVTFDTAVEALTSPTMESGLFNGRRSFEWSWHVQNVCAEEHVNASWDLAVDPAQIPPGWRVDAGYELGVLFSRGVTLTPVDNAANRRVYRGQASLGLSQLYEGKPGQFLVWIAISFTSQGDFTGDRGIAQRVLQDLSLTAPYKLYKAD